MIAALRTDFPYKTLFLIRFLTLATACILPLSDPHTHRQTDTLGIVLRYWNRWTLGSSETGWMHLFPAALNSSDSFGYVVTEAPVLNLVLAPWFVLGSFWGSVGTRFTLLCLVFGLLLLCARWFDDVRVLGVPIRRVALLFPLFSIGALFTGKFIPDPFATVAVLAALAWSWNRKGFWVPFLFASTGLLIKPTAVVVLAWIFLHPHPRDWKRWAWVIPSLGVGAAYYLGVVPLLLSYQDAPFAFYVAVRSPIQSLVRFFSDAKGVFQLSARHFFTQFGTAVLGLGWLLGGAKISKEYLRVFVVLLLQTVAIGALDGTHALLHLYYFIGVAPTVCLIVLGFLHSDQIPRVARALLGIVMLVSLFKTVAREWQFAQPTYVYTEQLRSSCSALKTRNPGFPWHQEKRFRSGLEQYPTLGLCFGERSAATKGEFGFFYGSKRIPGDCAIVDRDGSVFLTRCEL